MTHASLFSGIGGFDYAAALLGWINIFDCEIDAFCRKVLEYHFPNSVHYGDITKQIFKEWRGKIDVLSGGFPCQPFSLAGQRKGADDNRYLWPQMLRAIREIRPTWVVGENVAGILTMVQPGAEVEVGGQASLFGEDYRKRVLSVLERFVENVLSNEFQLKAILILFSLLGLVFICTSFYNPALLFLAFPCIITVIACINELNKK